MPRACNSTSACSDFSGDWFVLLSISLISVSSSFCLYALLQAACKLLHQCAYWYSAGMIAGNPQIAPTVPLPPEVWSSLLWSVGVIRLWLYVLYTPPPLERTLKLHAARCGNISGILPTQAQLFIVTAFRSGWRNSRVTAYFPSITTCGPNFRWSCCCWHKAAGLSGWDNIIAFYLLHTYDDVGIYIHVMLVENTVFSQWWQYRQYRFR